MAGARAIMFIALCGFIITAGVVLIRNCPYRVPALALLNTLVVFCLFNNMIASAAILPSLIWPLRCCRLADCSKRGACSRLLEAQAPLLGEGSQ